MDMFTASEIVYSAWEKTKNHCYTIQVTEKKA